MRRNVRVRPRMLRRRRRHKKDWEVVVRCVMCGQDHTIATFKLKRLAVAFLRVFRAPRGRTAWLRQGWPTW